MNEIKGLSEIREPSTSTHHYSPKCSIYCADYLFFILKEKKNYYIWKMFLCGARYITDKYYVIKVKEW